MHIPTPAGDAGVLDVLIVGTQRLVTPWTRTRVDA